MNRAVKVHVLVSLSFLLWSATTTFGQAVFTASRTTEINLFGAGSLVEPGYVSNWQEGYTAGIDISYAIRGFPLLPSLELRASMAPKGDTMGEKVFGGGLKFERRFRRLRPYVNLLVSEGEIDFTHPAYLAYDNTYYKRDLSRVFTYGGGIDYDLSHHFALKAEIQASHWNINNPTPPSTFFPVQPSVGIVFRVPFSDRYRE